MRPGKEKRISLSPKTKRATLKVPSRNLKFANHASVASFQPIRAFYEQWGAYLLLASFALTVTGLLSLPNFHANLASGGMADRLFVHPSLLLAGFLGLASCFYFLPEGTTKATEIPRWAAYPVFMLFLGFCFFSRFYHPEVPPANFWYDNLIITSDIRNVIDFHRYYLLFPFGSREPFYPYLTVLLWELFPKATGILITRLSCTFIDLGSIWGLYLLGRTIANRGLGLILMSFWAFSMPMTIWTFFVGGTNTAAFATIWTLVFFFRLIQKPTLARFIYWGIAMGFGGYCYVPFRPWTPVLITVVLLWIILGSKERPKGISSWGLAAGLWVSWAFLFFYKNNFLHSSNPLVAVFVSPLGLGLEALVLAFTFLKAAYETGKNETNRKIVSWATGALVTALVMSPLYLNPIYSNHTSDASVFGETGGMGLVKTLFQHVRFFMEAMFATPSWDVSWYPFPNHSYFEFFPELAMFLGLAYFLARPSWIITFVLLMVTVGMVPFVFSRGPHTGRVEGAVAPLFLLGGLGLSNFWNLFCQKIKDSTTRKALFLVILGLWVWDANWSFTLCQKWMLLASNDKVIGGQVDKDWKQFRVMVAQHDPGFVMESFTLLCDQREVWLLNDSNHIYLEPGQKGRDIVLLVHGEDKTTEERVRKDFPQAQWTEIANANGPHFMDRILIPFESLAEKPGKLLFVQRVPPDYWRRRFYYKEYGLARGLMVWDERVPSLDAPLPQQVNVWMTGRADGEINIPAPGQYTFYSEPSVEIVDLSIDGKKIIDLKPPEGQTKSGRGAIFLTQGSHQVSYATTFRSLAHYTIIHILPPKGGKEWLLGLSS